MGELVGWKPKSHDREVASVRFRCLAPMGELQRTGFGIDLYSEDAETAGAYQLVIFSKLYSPADQKIAERLRKRGVRTILDLSDNHFYNPLELPEYVAASAHLRTMCGLVDRVVCCSPHLAHVVAQEVKLDRPPLVVGDAVEQGLLPAVSTDAFERHECFRMLWFGSHGSPNAPAGMEDLLRIRPYLAAAQAKRKCELTVLSNNREKYASIAPNLDAPSVYVEWSDTALGAALASANVVVVPISLNPFTKCKSNNRVATALWYGVPVIADRIPAYEDFRSFAFIDDWQAGFDHALAGSREIRLRTAAGSAYARQSFSIAAIAAEWRRAIKTVLGQSVAA
jgi:hypothetical protein